jgi:trehalose 6-phosphate synthase
VFVQDYHFALAPQWIRKHLPMSRIAAFWHIPWPRPDRLDICPWSRSLLQGLLGSSVIGFQTSEDRRNFFDCVARMPTAELRREENVVTYQGRRVSVGVYPASIAWPGRWASSAKSTSATRLDVRRELQLPDDTRLAVGVDRLDYTKGLEHKFLAVERLLQRRPWLVGRFALVQLAEPTRVTVPVYRDVRARVLQTAERVNRRFGGSGARPITVLESHHAPATVSRYFRAADVCYVGSLHDGMNLVAKEFVCSRSDLRGVLLLSAYAGAADELTDAVQINPYDIDACAAALARALDMPLGEQARRMRRLRAVVSQADAVSWGTRIMRDLSTQETAGHAASAAMASGLAAGMLVAIR